MDLLTLSFDILGALISIGFIWITIASKRSLIGSFFKRYYGLMTIAAILFGLGFVLEILGKFVAISAGAVDITHHILLIAAGIMFTYTGIVLPKEAAKLAGTSEILKKP